MLFESPLRVLIVEDEGIIAFDISTMIQQLGYEVAGEAGTAEQAVELAGRVAVDVVLMDIKLRGKTDGIEAAREIREKLGVPVIFLTSHADSETLKRVKQTQPYGYVVKPFSEADLKVAIEVGLSRYRLQEELEEKRGWFEAALESSENAIIATDSEGRVAFLNSVAEKFTGWPANKARHLFLRNIISMQDTNADVGALDLDVLFETDELVHLGSAVINHRSGTKQTAIGSMGPMRRSGSAVVYGLLVNLKVA